MEFEFDAEKSASNKQKHGIDFIEAQSIWDDPNATEIAARSEEENRLIIVGMIRERLWAAIVTYRGEKIRIISVRRARRGEVKAYEKT